MTQQQLKKNRNWAIVAIIFGNLMYLIPLIATISFCSMYGNWDKMDVAWVFSALFAIVYFVVIIIAIYDVVKDYNKKKRFWRRIKMEEIKDKIDELIKTGWSYGKLAKELGVSKTTISRWHKGENKPSYPYYEEQLDYLLRQPVRKDCQIDNQKDAEITLSVDEQIKWHEQKIAELKAQKEKEKWQFSEDEKVILRNLDKKYKWILREDNCLFIFEGCPTKYGLAWDDLDSSGVELGGLNHLFKCIKENEGPCEFRKFI